MKVDVIIISVFALQMQSETQLRVTFKSAPNIALVKYWGKYHQTEILPINDSTGLTLNTDDISTTTTCTFSNQIVQDTFVLNGKSTSINNRLSKLLQKVRQQARKQGKYLQMDQKEWQKYHFKVQSENSFPSASGMASSASGYSCLAAALNHLFGNIFNQQELSRLARNGSGSASRALYGGLVRWKGVDQKYLTIEDPLPAEQLQQLSQKCISFQTNPSSDLSFIRIIALITQNKQKQVSSTKGMQTSIQTSQFIKYRNQIANNRITKIEELLQRIHQAREKKEKEQEYKLYGEFAQNVIKDSNSFHSVCLDTYPPIFYLNQFSKQIIYIVDHIFNTQSKQTKVAYTFDAGPHGFLFVHEDMIDSVLSYLCRIFDNKEEVLNPKAKHIISQSQNNKAEFREYQGVKIAPKGIWVTEVGRGPEEVQKQ